MPWITPSKNVWRQVVLSVLLHFIAPTSLLIASEATLGDVEVGIQNVYKMGFLTPINAIVETTESGTYRLAAVTVDSSGHEVVHLGEEFQSSSSAVQPAHVVMQFSSVDHQALDGTRYCTARLELQRKIDDRWRTIATKRLGLRDSLPALKPKLKLIIALGTPEQLAASINQDQQSAELFKLLELESPNALPNQAVGYDAVDLVMLNGTHDLTSEQHRALQTYVSQGGHLILSIGRDADQYKTSPLDDWVPLKIASSTKFRDLRVLESFVSQTIRITVREPLPGVQLESNSGTVLLKVYGQPIAARAPYGFGKVTFLGIDLNEAPLAKWPPLAQFCRQLMELRTNSEATDVIDNGDRTLTKSGITDLGTELLAIQSHLAESTSSPAWFVFGMIVVVSLAIGPLDYFIVHQVFGKPFATWLTFPILITGLSAAFISLSLKDQNSDDSLVQTNFIDFDLATGTERVESFATLYSRKTQVVSIDIDHDQNPRHQPRVRLLAEPEDAFGGLYRSSAIQLGSARFTVDRSQSSISSIPMRRGSTRQISTQWLVSDPNSDNTSAEPPVTHNMEGTAAGQLSGRFTWKLPYELKNWSISYGSLIYYPDPNKDRTTLGQHQDISPKNDPGMKRRELRGYLTGERRNTVETENGTKEELIITQSRYDPLEFNLSRFAHVLTFHDEVGAEDYTGLSNIMLRHHDFSDIVELDRAVIFGEIDAPPPCTYQVNSQSLKPTSNRTFVRIVIPIKRIQSSIEKLPDLLTPEEKAEVQRRQLEARKKQNSRGITSSGREEF